MIVSFLRKAMRPRASQEWVVGYVTGRADPKGSTLVVGWTSLVNTSLDVAEKVFAAVINTYSQLTLRSLPLMVWVQFSSVAQLCPTLCDPMDCSMPGVPVHHQLLELTQSHVHQVGDAIQPSHPLPSPSPLVFSLSQHQGLFK